MGAVLQARLPRVAVPIGRRELWLVGPAPTLCRHCRARPPGLLTTSTTFSNTRGRLTPIGCVDDVVVPESFQARIAVETEEGVRYLIQAGGHNGLSGDLVTVIDE